MRRILIVDDSKELLEFFSLLLTGKGYKVRTACNKATLMLQLTDFIPHIILLDVMLGGDNGREICHAIKKSTDGKNIHIILLSASPELLHNHTECDADDVIEKPFDIATVIKKIEKACTNSKVLL